jgi:molybdopterin-guanine dinucleotide biosynthesis protein A
LVGLWPAELADGLAAYLDAGERRVRDWVASTGAYAVDLGPLLNLNRADDLAMTAATVQDSMTPLSGRTS